MIYRVNSMDDFGDYFNIKADMFAIYWSGFASAPDREKLREHFERLIKDRKEIVFFMREDTTNEIIGYQQYTDLDNKLAEGKGLSIIQKFQGCGYAQELLAGTLSFMKEAGFKKIISWVSENNKASILNLRINKFYRSTRLPDKEVYFPIFNRTDKMLFVERDL